MSLMLWLIPLAVFGAVSAAVVSIVLYARGAGERQLQERLKTIQHDAEPEEKQSLLRESYLRELTPAERWLEKLPGMNVLERISEQSGRRVPAYRIVLLALVLAVGAGLPLLLLGRPLLALLACAVGLALPFFKLVQDRNARVERFDAQLADVLDVMGRALRAGNPFTETLKVVSEEMTEPVASEFGVTFSDINYGVSVRAAFHGLLERVPSLGLAAMVTAVLVQRETGGNMAEILERVAQILRLRYRFRRRLRTLSAEGRMSAWILILMPFALAVVLSIFSPTYLPKLTHDPLGAQLIAAAMVIMTVGVFWIRRVIQVRF